MKYKYTLLIILLFLGFSQISYSQNLKLRKAPDLKLDPSMNSDELDQIMETLEKVLNEYAAASKLLDLDRKQVTDSSIDRFNDLFTPNGVVVRDFAEFPSEDLVSYKDYSNEVYNQMKGKGIEAIIESAELVEVKKNQSMGFYFPKIKVVKKRFNSLSADGSINSIAMGESMELYIVYDIYIDDPGRATISKIEQSVANGGSVEEYTRLFSISASAGTSTYGPSVSSYWDQNHNSSSIDVKGGIDFSFGVEILFDKFITPKKSRNRNLALSAGLRFGSYKTSTELRSFSLAPFLATAMRNETTNRYMRLVGPVNVDEDIRFNVLEIPLGVSYRFVKKPTSLIYLHMRLIPGFILGGKGELVGNAFYDGILINEDPNLQSLEVGDITEMRLMRLGAAHSDLLFDVDGFGPYELGAQGFTYDAQPELKGTTLALQLSPTAYFNFVDDNPGWGVLVGLDLTYRFGSFIKHNSITSANDEAFQFSDERGFNNSSIMNYYLDDLSGFHVGFRIGLFQRLNTEP